jgi:hypothetical protein
MRFGFFILLGPLKFYFGTSRPQFSPGRGRPARRNTPAKEVETSREVTKAPVKPTARDTISMPTFQLDPAVRADSIAALVTLGFPKRQAQTRVNGVKSGSSTEEVIKAALQGGR